MWVVNCGLFITWHWQMLRKWNEELIDNLGAILVKWCIFCVNKQNTEIILLVRYFSAIKILREIKVGNFRHFENVQHFHMSKNAVFEPLKLPHFISRKIWVAVKFWNFHTVPIITHLPPFCGIGGVLSPVIEAKCSASETLFRSQLIELVKNLEVMFLGGRLWGY